MFFFFQAEDGIRYFHVTGVQTCALPIFGRRLEPGGTWRRIPPVEVGADRAPCKEVVRRGDEVDIEQFAWLKNNPADGGRYVNIKIGRASCRERGSIEAVAESLTKKAARE